MEHLYHAVRRFFQGLNQLFLPSVRAEGPQKKRPDDAEELSPWRRRELEKDGPVVLSGLTKAFDSLKQQNTVDGVRAVDLTAHFALQAIDKKISAIKTALEEVDAHAYEQLQAGRVLTQRIQTLGLKA